MSKVNQFDEHMRSQSILLEAILEKLEIQNIDINQLGVPEYNFKLPKKSPAELYEFNKSLNVWHNKQYLIKQLSLIGASNARLLTTRVIDGLMTSECLNSICWKGTESKSSIQDFKNILDVILLTVKKRHPEIVDVGSLVENILKNKFRNVNKIISKQSN